MEKKFHPKLLAVLHKMCEMVNIEPQPEEFFKDSRWFLEYSWTQETEDSFIKWLVNEMATNKELRLVISNTNIKTKKHLTKVAKAFVWNYGWKTI